MSASDPEAEFYDRFDDMNSLLWSHGIQTEQPEGMFNAKFYSYVKSCCSDVDDWSLNESQLRDCFRLFLQELAG